MKPLFSLLMLAHVLTEAFIAPFAVLVLFAPYHEILPVPVLLLVVFGLLLSTVLILSQFSMQDGAYSTAITVKNLLKYVHRAADPFLVAGVVAFIAQTLFLGELFYVLSISFGVRMIGHAFAATREWYEKEKRDWSVLMALPALFSGVLPFLIVLWNVVLAELSLWRIGLTAGYVIYAATRYGSSLRI